MLIHQIRNATLIVTYHNQKFLIDPWLMPKDYMAGFDVGMNPEVRQPRVDLPIGIDEITKADAVILTHFHPDHWDEFAAKALDKRLPLFVQSETDLKVMQGLGFKDVRVINEYTVFEGVKLYKTGGQHGRREVIEPLCRQIDMPYDAMGIVFEAPDEKTLYLAGDTIWCEEVKQAIDEFTPKVIVVNACGAMLQNGEKIIMDAADVKTVATYAPSAVVVASHMDTVSHLTVTRQDIKNLHLANVVVPDDNEILKF